MGCSPKLRHFKAMSSNALIRRMGSSPKCGHFKAFFSSTRFPFNGRVAYLSDRIGFFDQEALCIHLNCTAHVLERGALHTMKIENTCIDWEPIDVIIRPTSKCPRWRGSKKRYNVVADASYR